MCIARILPQRPSIQKHKQLAAANFWDLVLWVARLRTTIENKLFVRVAWLERPRGTEGTGGHVTAIEMARHLGPIRTGGN